MVRLYKIKHTRCRDVVIEVRLINIINVSYKIQNAHE